MPSKISKLSTNKSIAVIIWLAGAWMTVQALAQMGVPDPINVVIGISIQLALTWAERPIWRGRGFPKMAIGALIVDVCVNSAGAWPYTQNVGKTDFWNMIKQVSGNDGLSPNTVTQLAFAIGVGAFTAASAEYFWNLPE